jgi:hypothetical protein
MLLRHLIVFRDNDWLLKFIVNGAYSKGFSRKGRLAEDRKGMVNFKTF